MVLSVIVPCYNEEEVLLETYRQLRQVLISTDLENFELIFINDGSTDNSINLLQKICAKDNNVKVINFSRNFGHQIAVTAGINNCSGDFAVIFDADLQDPPKIILEMLKIQKVENANVVYGVRKIRRGESWFKVKTASAFYIILNYLSDMKFPLNTGDFRLIDRKVIDEFNRLEEKNKYVRGLISWIGFKQVPLYYERDERFAGETKYPLSKMLKFATLALTYFSKKPLMISTVIGIISTFISAAVGIWLIVGQLLGITEVIGGWTSLIITVIFFGGIQLLTIGVLGQYMGILFDEAKNRPEYIIKSKLNF